MFNEYYYIEKTEEPVYFSIITLNNSVETSLYKGKRLEIRKSLQRGIHLLRKDNLSLKIQIKWFRVIPELKIDNEVVSLVKVNRKELRNKLKEHNITNELNPKTLPKEPIKITSLKTPGIIIIIGTIWQILMEDKAGFWQIPSMILFIIAYVSLFGNRIDKIPQRRMDDETKVKFKFIVGIAGMAITQIIISKLASVLT